MPESANPELGTNRRFAACRFTHPAQRVAALESAITLAPVSQPELPGAHAQSQSARIKIRLSDFYCYRGDVEEGGAL